MADWQLILTSEWLHQAHVWRSRLEAEGIPAEVVSKSASAYGIFTWARRYELWVPVAQAPQALLILHDVA